jgi:hypothetical protein
VICNFLSDVFCKKAQGDCQKNHEEFQRIFFPFFVVVDVFVRMMYFHVLIKKNLNTGFTVWE